MTEQELVAQLKAYDSDALNRIMDLYGNDILRFVILLVKDRHLAEDICQETFIRAYQKINQFKGSGPLKGWLLQIALNRAREKMRSSYFRRMLPKIFTENEIIDAYQDPVTKLEQSELLIMIHKLPHKYKEVLLLFYYEDLSIREITQLLQEKEGTIKSKLSRARELLKTLLEKEGWDDAALRRSEAGTK